MDLTAKRQTYLNVIQRLQEAHDATTRDAVRAIYSARIASEKRLLARLDEGKRK